MAKPGRMSAPPKKLSVSKPKAKPAPTKAKPKAPKKVQAKKAVVSRAKPARAARPAGKAQVTTKGFTPARRPPAQPPQAQAAPAVRPKTPPPPQPPPRRSTYIDAVAIYERGIQLLQARKYKESAESLKTVISQFPEEKELHERALLYLRVCERGIASTPQRPETAEDRVYAATLAINNGSLDQAVGILTAVIHKDPEHDQAFYMLGVAHALKGNAELALQHLARSMALNDENRDLAFKEPDLEALRRTGEMKALLASPPAPVPRKDKGPVSKPRKG